MSFNDGCQRTGTAKKLLNPIRSARLYTRGQFGFKYGRVEVKAKLPRGDWLFPAIWLQPFRNVYGNWPMSGEIDLVESRGNDKLFLDGKNIGSERVSTAIHYGLNSSYEFRKYQTYDKFSAAGHGYNDDFHRFQMIWTPG
jgi:beta-glucanase (GH16 family)